MAQSVFRGIIEFFNEIGIYDVVLPFLLVFTVVFAILEKTMILGYEKVGSDKYPKKNLNAMVAFVLAFLVVASTQLVAAINESMASIVLLLLLSVGFMLLVGSFYSQNEFSLQNDNVWKNIFTIIMFVGIVLIFLNSVGWLEASWDYVADHWNDTAVASIFLLLIVGGIVAIITRDGKPKGGSSQGNSNSNGNGGN